MEKEVQHQLISIFDNYNIDKQYRYCNPSFSVFLKSIFKKSSKTGNGRGIPDYIYYDKKNILICECKWKNITVASNESQFYALKCMKKIRKQDRLGINIYWCGFSETTNELYKCIYTDKIYFEKLDTSLDKFILDLKTNINNTTFNKMTMNSTIHKIHNYIRDNTKISDEDKGLFIGGLILALENPSFYEFVSNISTTDISSNLVYELKKVNIDLEYVYSSLNNIHLLTLARFVKDIIDKNPGIDLLNEFYNEFVKYQNTDSKSLGIVLTPEHVVKLMIKLLNINKDDVFLDICSGTGSFLCESLKYNPKRIIGCEYQKKLYLLLQINNILRKNTFNCINCDCFYHDFSQYEPTKSAINPPYGMKDKCELEFVLKQVESIKEEGSMVVILPKAKLNDTKKNNTLKYKIISTCKIKTIILCNPKLFEPNASIECCIVLLEKNSKHPHDFEKDTVNVIDYTDDGLETKIHNGKIKDDLFDVKFNNVLIAKNFVLLKKNSDWWHVSDTVVDIEKYNKLFVEYTITKIKEDRIKKLEDELEIEKIKLIDTCKDKIPNIKLFTIKNIITLYPNKNILIKNCKEKKEDEYIYPVVSSSKFNNGIKNYFKDFFLENVFTINKDGSIGYCFFHPYKFAYTGHVIAFDVVFKIKNKELLSFIFTDKFSNGKYNFSCALSRDRFLNDTIYLPVDTNGNIDI